MVGEVKKRTWIWVVLVVLILIILPIILAIIFKNYKIWLYSFIGIIFLVSILGVVYLIKQKNNKAKTIDLEQITKPRVVDNDECRKISEGIIREVIEDNVIEKNEEIANMGEVGNYKTPIYHLFGKLYYSGLFHIFINMNNPKRYSYRTSEDLKKEDIEGIMNKLAEFPYAEEKTTDITEYPTGVKVVREIKRQTHAEKMLEQQKQAEEEQQLK